MKRSLIILCLCLSANALAAEPSEKVVTVYAYDSFVSKSGLGPFLKDYAKRKYDITTNFVSFAAEGEALNQVAVEGAATKADILVGIDAGMAGKAKEMGLFSPIPERLFAAIPNDLRLGKDTLFLPFDYGFLAFVYDSRRVLPPKEASLTSLASAKAWKKKVVIEDPRTSSIGLSFLGWTRLAIPEWLAWENFWKGFSSQLVATSAGWSAAYGMFLKGEAEFVLSYTTSPAYHAEVEKKDFYRALIFPEGNLRQIETAVLVKKEKPSKLAEQWLEALLSEEVQTKLPTVQWMYPARQATRLPDSFKKLPPVQKVLNLDPIQVENTKKEWLRRWSMISTK